MCNVISIINKTFNFRFLWFTHNAIGYENRPSFSVDIFCALRDTSLRLVTQLVSRSDLIEHKGFQVFDMEKYYNHLKRTILENVPL
jgi:hypothetical protein